ncbi:MAG: 16S rRNA (uracil(1498)-N(3))-methyltransferase [Planctomycetes bacterium]|nr:16S rRNA (uracil(1498)-N(3))-methyltransferase [Planctomycetota bacterium]
MPRRFYCPSLLESGSVVLEGPEAHHLIHVLRAETGEIAEVFDGRGLVASARVTSVRKRDVELKILSARRDDTSRRQIILGTAVPKGDRFEWLVEKATELGVTRLVPLVTARSVVDPRDSKLEKLRQAVITACKQSGRNHLMEVSAVTAWSDFVQADLSQHSSFVAHPGPDAEQVSPGLLKGLPSVVFAVGPEGGFADNEVAMALAVGARSIRLGPLILRIETAALALAAFAAL